jgi:hypothetical protein
MSNGGPYKPSRPPQWWLQKVYEDQAKHINKNSYQLNDKYMQIVIPHLYIAGRCYSAVTGKLIKNANTKM